MTVSCRTAAMTPPGMAIMEAISTAMTPSCALTAMRGSIRSSTGWRLIHEMPKSPRANLAAHVAYWICNGLSSPNWLRTRAKSSSVATSAWSRPPSSSVVA